MKSPYLKLCEALERVKETGRNKIWIIGNGGSLTQAEHFAGELLPDGIPCIALTHPGVLSAIANDWGVDKMFSLQLKAVVYPNDVLICLTTSNMSKNIREAQVVASKLGAKVFVITGLDSPETAWGINVRVASQNTQGIQEETLNLLHDLWKDCKEIWK